MPDKTAIEWTDATWNPIRGCSRVSEGCRNCYAEPIAARFSGPSQPYDGLSKFVTPAGSNKREARWTGRVAFAEHLLDQPLRWRAPRRIFVNSMSDLFHESVPDEWIDRIFAVMALCPQHTFQILTKRPARMRNYFSETWQVAAQPAQTNLGVEIPAQQATIEDRWHQIESAIDSLTLDNRLFNQDRFWTSEGQLIGRIAWPHEPLPNVWLGVSVEDQVTADTRIPILLQTPAAKRFISAEPLLGLIDLVSVLALPPPRGTFFTAAAKLCSDSACRRPGRHYPREFNCRWGKEPMGLPGLDWVIVGGESGPGARPMHPDWAVTLRDQCAAAGTPFFFKQWGEWLPGSYRLEEDGLYFDTRDGRTFPGRKSWPALHFFDTADAVRFEGPGMAPIGKTWTGRLLDGRTHDGIPS